MAAEAPVRGPVPSAGALGRPSEPDPRLPGPDRVTLTGVAAVGHHGVFDFEREQGQRFVVDLTCALDLGPAARSDDLGQTLDYGTLAQAVVADIEGPPLNLIEALADRIARTCLTHPSVRTVEVTVHKPQAPVPVEFADVAVTLIRSRHD